MNQLAQFLLTRAWAMRPDYLAAMMKWASDGDELAHHLITRNSAARGTSRPATGAIGVIPVQGPLSNRSDFFSELFGASSYQGIAQAVRQALADPTIATILLDIDSPGGEVTGCMELCAELQAARDVKTIVAVANSMAASAAYWIGSQASELWVTPSGEVGSIGVWMGHGDFSKMYEMYGISVTLIQAGKYKTEGNPYGPLDDEAKARFQAETDSYYDDFVRGVAGGRGTTLKAVKADMGEGRMLRAEPAKAAKMVDRIGTMSDVLARLGVKSSAGAAKAEEPAHSVVAQSAGAGSEGYRRWFELAE
jgi:capsid assembly protease